MPELMLRFQTVLGWALIYNVIVVGVFAFAYLIEVKLSGLKKAGEKGDPLAVAAMERADGAMKRFIPIYLTAQVVLSLVVIFFVEELLGERFAMLVFMPSFLLGYSQFLFFRRDYYARLKEVITQTGEEVLIDFDRRVLDRIMNWKLEVASGIGFAIAASLYFDYDSAAYTLSPMLLMLYASVRTRKYFVRYGFWHWNTALLYTNVVVQMLKLGAVYDGSTEFTGGFSSGGILLIAGTSVVMAVQLLLGLIHLPRVRRDICEATAER